MLAERYKGEWLPLALFFTVLSAISLIGIIGLGRYRDGKQPEQAAALATN